jgi:hypothetical protein
MLLSLRSILKRPVLARGEKSGYVRDILLDVRTWSVSYVVAGIGRLFHPRAVVIPTFLVNSIPFGQPYVPITLSVAEVRDCATPASLSTLPTGDIFSAYRGRLPRRRIPEPARAQRAPDPSDPRSNIADEPPLPDLRSAADLLTYRAAAMDGSDLGSLADFILDDANFSVQHIVICRGLGPFMHWTAVPPACVAAIVAVQRAIRTDGMREAYRWSRNPWRAALEDPRANSLLSMNRPTAAPQAHSGSEEDPQ